MKIEQIWSLWQIFFSKIRRNVSFVSAGFGWLQILKHMSIPVFYFIFFKGVFWNIRSLWNMLSCFLNQINLKKVWLKILSLIFMPASQRIWRTYSSNLTLNSSCLFCILKKICNASLNNVWANISRKLKKYPVLKSEIL